MGYEIHITRAQHWTDADLSPITIEEWCSYISNDFEMQLDCFAEAVSPQGDTIRYENEGLAVWTKYSKYGVQGNKAWFDYRDGRIVVKSPDDEIIRKMIEISERLQAFVIGDEGERYPSTDSAIV